MQTLARTRLLERATPALLACPLAWAVARGQPDGMDPADESASNQDPARARAARQPSVRALQAAAMRAARLEPERVAAWERRIRVSSLLPAVRVRVGRGGGELRATSD